MTENEIRSTRYRSVGMTGLSVISTKVAQQLRGDIYSLYALLRRYLDYARYDGKRDTLHSLRSVGMTDRRMPSSVGMTDRRIPSSVGMTAEVGMAIHRTVGNGLDHSVS